MKTRTTADRYNAMDAKRQESLDMARRCAAQTKPHLMPPENFDKYTELPEKYHSLGSRGLTTMGGRVLAGVYPDGIPWAQLVMPPEIEYGGLDPQVVNEARNLLYQRMILILAAIEQGDVNYSLGSVQGFRTQKRKSLEQTIGTGDSLELINDDYTITVFRRDHYVNHVDSSGRAIRHIAKQCVHISTLSDEVIAKAKLDPKDYEDRDVDLYTEVEWQGSSRQWVFRQEINEIVVNESDEKVSPFIWTPFDLVEGESYGRGWVEQNIADLETYNAIMERILDWAELCSKALPIIDPNSLLKPKDLEQPSGTVLIDRVSGGIPAHLSFARVDKLQDLSFVGSVQERLKNDLARAMLVQTDSVRDSERTTAFEVQEVTIRELEGALGGFYAPIADRQQIPTLHRVAYMLERDKKIQPIKIEGKALQFKTLTGLAALQSTRQFQTLQAFVASVGQLLQNAPMEIDRRILIDSMARYANISVPGLVKTPAQIAAEIEQMQAQQIQAAAAQQAITTTGNVVEQQAAARNAAV